MTAPIRLVLADDTEPLRMLLRRVFEADPRFEVVGEAADGREALDQVRQLQPDLLLLDLSMPTMDGLEVLDHLRPLQAETKVIVLSGHAADAAAQASIERGALAYIEKGVRPVELLGSIDDIMRAASSGVFEPVTLRSVGDSNDGQVEQASDTTAQPTEPPADSGSRRPRDSRIEPPTEQPTLDTMVSQLVHDLRSPLGLAVGYLDLLRRKDLGAEPTVLLERVEMAMGHLDDLVTTLGAYARVDRTPLTRASVPVVDVVSEALARLREQHGGQLEHITVDDQDCVVHGDATALVEVVYQLLENAVRYGNEEPVAVRAAMNGDSVTIEVVDRGPGLDDDDGPVLFQPFKRGMAARGNWGTGLGLALSARLVAAMDGRIWACNDPAGGAVFTVELPAGRYADAGQSD